MEQAIICQQPVHTVAQHCWTVTLDAQRHGWLDTASSLIDKLMPALISALVALAILEIGRRREKRKLSLDIYKEYFSEDLAKHRYDAEMFFEQHPGTDWSITDPFEVPDKLEVRTGYAAVTRFIARLSVLYQEKELDREFAEKLLSRVIGYWWGYVFEQMTQRQSMYTRRAIIYICGQLKQGSRSGDFKEGYQDGLKRRNG